MYKLKVLKKMGQNKFLPISLIILTVILLLNIYSLKNQNKVLSTELALYKNQEQLSTATPSPSPSPTPTQKNKVSTIALHIDAIDYSDGRPAGLITENITVKLYDMKDNLLQQKTPSPYVDNGKVGIGGDTVFYVLPSTYKIIAETPNTSGSCIMIVRSTTEYNSCAIYLVRK
jgi:hypothetical protein